MPCRNWTDLDACNWFTPAADNGGGYCISCSLNEVVPDLPRPAAARALGGDRACETAPLFTVLELGLPLLARRQATAALSAARGRRADTGDVDPPQEEPIYIGHDNGCLTVNVMEADDAVREAMRKRMNERYRTMLGHLRHEIGHYYWYLLVGGIHPAEPFRALFGDERSDYDAALAKHY